MTGASAGLSGRKAGMSKAERIFQLAQKGADAYGMYKARRAGGGTPYINEVLNHLKLLVTQEFGADVVDRFLSEEAHQSVDFWLADEQTMVEMEFDIFSSPPILEKEIFKALLAKDAGKDVRRLVLIGDPGSVVLSRAPMALSIIDWVARHHRIEVQVWELKDKDEA